MKNKPFKCGQCGRRFTTHQGRKQHVFDKHGMGNIDKSTRCEIAREVYEDLPDGAFFAAAQSEFGLEPEDFIDV